MLIHCEDLPRWHSVDVCVDLTMLDVCLRWFQEVLCLMWFVSCIYHRTLACRDMHADAELHLLRDNVPPRNGKASDPLGVSLK